MRFLIILVLLSHSVCAAKRLSQPEKVTALRAMLNGKQLHLITMPCCYDGLSARLVEQAGFDLTFMTGFGVSASIGLPDTGLISSNEMVNAATVICNALERIPCIGDGDTGYGNVANIQRTVRQYIAAGLSGIMIEDQVAPKRCGHTRGKQVVERDEAYRRIKAAVDERDNGSGDIVILARTDARVLGIDEAIERCRKFREIGADWTFLEAPQSEEEMERYCREVDGPKLANMLEFGLTPILPASRLQELGYTVAAYPLTLLSASAKAIQEQLLALKGGEKEGEAAANRAAGLLSFKELQGVVGFDEYYKTMDDYNLQ